MSEENKADAIPRLGELAEFRYQLRTFLSFSETASEGFGIAAQQYQLMQVIGSAPADRQATIGYLADRMILRHNSTVELVDRAERAGLVERRHDEQDLRKSLVQLTPEGWSILRRLVALHLEELDTHGGEILRTLRNLQASAQKNDVAGNTAADGKR